MSKFIVSIAAFVDHNLTAVRYIEVLEDISTMLHESVVAEISGIDPPAELYRMVNFMSLRQRSNPHRQYRTYVIESDIDLKNLLDSDESIESSLIDLIVEKGTAITI